MNNNSHDLAMRLIRSWLPRTLSLLRLGELGAGEIPDSLKDWAKLKARQADLERIVDTLERILHRLRLFAYRNASEMVRIGGCEGAISQVEVSHARAPFTEFKDESRALVLAVSQGVTLGQFLESESAASALEQFGNAAQREDQKP